MFNNYGEYLLKNKKIIGLVGTVVILFGIFFGIKYMKLNSMDGRYHFYYDDSQTYSDEVSLIIRGDEATFINDDKESFANLDKKNKTIKGWIEVPYRYQNGVFSFSDEQYAKEGSKAYENSK